MFMRGNRQSSADRGILVVRLGSMGDVIHALPAVSTLKHSFPSLPLTWVIEPKWAYLLSGNPFVDRVVELDRHTLAGLRQAWHELRLQRYAWAVDFQGLFKSALTASLARPDRIFGFHQSQAREPIAALFYSNRVRAGSAHIVDRNLELATGSGASSVVCTFPLPEGTPEGVLPEGDFVLASPLAGWLAKQWPLEYYSELARLLKAELDLPLVLNGPPRAGAALTPVHGTMTHLCGLPGLLHATRRALAVVGIDSGPMHLAAALDKPGVAVFGPTDPNRNGPYGKSFAVLRVPGAETSYKRRQEISDCMKAITPEAVYQTLKDRISARS
jgi:heptosyltransferase-1